MKEKGRESVLHVRRLKGPCHGDFDRVSSNKLIGEASGLKRYIK